MTDVTAPLTTDRQAPVHSEWPRCDRCGGWSRWRFEHYSNGHGTELVFCDRHGGYDVRQALRAAGWLVFKRIEQHP